MANLFFKRLLGLDDMSQGSGTFQATGSQGQTLTLSQVPILTGNGSPQNVVTANVGCLYLRKDGGASTTLYVKESGSGNTGWVAK
jgi:hypothetical protein